MFSYLNTPLFSDIPLGLSRNFKVVIKSHNLLEANMSKKTSIKKNLQNFFQITLNIMTNIMMNIESDKKISDMKT